MSDAIFVKFNWDFVINEVSETGIDEIQLFQTSDTTYLLLIEQSNTYKSESINSNEIALFLLTDKIRYNYYLLAYKAADKGPRGKVAAKEWEKTNKVIHDCDTTPVYAWIVGGNEIGTGKIAIGKIETYYSADGNKFLKNIYSKIYNTRNYKAFFLSDKIVLSNKDINNFDCLQEIKNDMNGKKPLQHVKCDYNKFKADWDFIKNKPRIDRQIESVFKSRQKLSNFFKGKIAELIFRLICGELLKYNVTSTGYENWNRDLMTDVRAGGGSDQTSQNIRRTPDFYVSSQEVNWITDFSKGWVEAKFRTYTNDENLKQDITKWKEQYSDVHIFLMLRHNDNNTPDFYFFKNNESISNLDDLKSRKLVNKVHPLMIEPLKAAIGSLTNTISELTTEVR